MTTVDNYNPITSLSNYFRSRTDRQTARLWSTEKALHDAAALGLVSFFEGPGTNPMALSGASTSKLWLRTTAGVTTAPGDVLRYSGSGASTDQANWTALTPSGFWAYLRDVGGAFLDVPVDADYPTRTDVIAATVPGTINYIRTGGYATVGDGGDALYVRSTAGTTKRYRFQSADGAWWYLASNTPTPEQFGAKGDGSTDDTISFTEGLEYTTTLFGRPGRLYSIANVVLNGRKFDGRGCGLRDASSAAYAIALNGYAPQLKNVFIQDQGNYAKITTSSASALSGATSISVTSATGFAIGQAIFIGTGSSIYRHYTIITNVSGTTITLRDALPAGMSAGAEVVALYGLIRVLDAVHWLIENVQVINGRGALMIQPTSTASASNRGTIKTLDVEGARYFGVLKAENAAGVKAYDLKLWCGWVDTRSYTGDGVTTTYAIGASVFLKRDVTVTVGGVAKTLGVDWSYSGTDLVFGSAPANGAAIVISHFRDGFYGLIEDQRNTSIISGGNGFIHVEILDAITGMYLNQTDLTDFDEIIVDTVSGQGIQLAAATTTCKFGKTFIGFCNSSIVAYGSNGVAFSGGLYTALVPASETVAGAVGDNILASNSKIIIDVSAWTGTDYGFTSASSGLLALKGALDFNIGTTANIPAATTAFMESYGGPYTITNNEGRVLLFRAASSAAPGAGQTFTYNLYSGATLIGTGTISGGASFTTGAVWCNTFLGAGSSLSVKVTTSAGAAATLHRTAISMA